MIIKLSKTDDSENVINKTLYDLIQLEIFPRSNFNTENPEIILNSSDFDFSVFNYLEIDSLGRKYVLIDFEYVSSNLIKMNFKTDLLEVYKSVVLNSDCIYNRKIESGDYNEYSTGRNVNPIIQIIEGSVTFDGNSLIMSTIGE